MKFPFFIRTSNLGVSADQTQYILIFFFDSLHNQDYSNSEFSVAKLCVQPCIIKFQERSSLALVCFLLVFDFWQNLSSYKIALIRKSVPDLHLPCFACLKFAFHVSEFEYAITHLLTRTVL